MVKSIVHALQKSRNSVLKGGIILFLGMNMVNLGNYLFNLLMGRMLGPSEYGGLMALMAILAIASVPAGTLQTAATKFSSMFQAKNETGKINFLLKYLINKTILLAIFVGIILLSSSLFLDKFLHLESKIPLIILAASSIFVFLLPINRGILQGIQNFKGLSINLVSEPALKIILGFILVAVGLKLNGAILSFLFAGTLVYFLSFYFLKSILRSQPQPFPTKHFWTYSLPTLVVLLLMNCLTFIDLIVVKHYFPPNEAGLYSGLSTIAKIVLYFSSPFIASMFPKISELYVKGEKHYFVLTQTLIIVTLLSTLVMSFFVLFPSFSIKLFFGNQYLSASPFLGELAIAMLILTLINVFVYYYLAIGQLKFIYVLIFFVALEIILINFYHHNFQEIINSLILSFGGLLFSLFLLYIYSKRKQIYYAFNHHSGL